MEKKIVIPPKPTPMNMEKEKEAQIQGLKWTINKLDAQDLRELRVINKIPRQFRQLTLEEFINAFHTRMDIP